MVLQKLHKNASGVTWFRATLNNPEFGLPAGDHDFGINRIGEMLNKSGEPTQWGQGLAGRCWIVCTT
jgi:hypothetical protein